MAGKRAYVVQIDKSSRVMDGSIVDCGRDLRITYWIGTPDAYLALGVLTEGALGINLESGWRVAEAEIPLEPVFMDADRQKLELDITREFEVADGEATLLIDETK